MTDKNRNFFLFTFLFVPALAVYMPGLSGGFVFDDYPNIVLNNLVNKDSWTLYDVWSGVWSGNAGPTKRPVAMLSFVLDSILWGLDPWIMKLENVLLHVFTAFVGYLLALRLLVLSGFEKKNAVIVSVCAALVWCVNPLNLTNVLYIVQRMNLLAALFTMLALLFYLKWRQPLSEGRFAIGPAFSALVCALLGVFSKENVILLPFYIVLIEIFFFQRPPSSVYEVGYNKFLTISSVILVLVVLGNLFYGYFGIENSYKSRDFTIDQRLLTELRVFFWYLGQVIFPNINGMTLYHDDVILSNGLFAPITTLFSFIGLLILAIGSWVYRNQFVILCFAFLMFFVSLLMETFTYGLELIFEHRVYFGGFWVFVGLIAVLSRAAEGHRKLPVKRYLVIAFTLYVGFLSAQTVLRSIDWSSDTRLVASDVLRNPDSYRANVEAGGVYANLLENASGTEEKEEAFLKATSYFEKALELKPNSGSACVAQLILNSRYYGEVAHKTVDKCRQIFQDHVDASSISILGNLVRCSAKGHCPEGEYILDLLDEAYETLSRAGSSNSALIIAHRANYYLEVLNEIDIAVMLYRRAVEVQPKRMSLRLQLLDLLVRQGRVDAARSVAQEMKKVDRVRAFCGIYQSLGLGC